MESQLETESVSLDSKGKENMKLKLVSVLLSLTTLTVLFSGCASSAGASSNANSTASVTVKLAQSIIDTAINAVKNKNDWGISLLDPTLKFLTGIMVEGAIVLHNGVDAERIVDLKYSQFTKPINRQIEGGTVTFYPADASNWVKIKEPQVRLKPMETRTVTISLYIPNGTKLEYDDWGFNITADAGMILKQSVSWVIVTGETTTDKGATVPDNFLEATLAVSLMSGSLSAITKLGSSIGEQLRAVSYDPRSMVLRIEGLTPSATRTITMEYETLGMFRQAYVQNWYVQMMH